MPTTVELLDTEQRTGLDPLIAHIPYASVNPVQEPPQTNITHIPEDQGPPIEGMGPVEPRFAPGIPTLSEIKEYNRLNGIVNPVLDLSAEEIANLATEDPEHFNLEQSLIKLQPHWDKELIGKSAEAYNLLERRGWKPAKDLGLSKLPGMAKDVVVGGASWLASLAKGAVGIPAALAMEKVDELMGLPPSPGAIRKRQELQQEIGETAAATEASVTGLAFLGEKAYNKIFGKKPELKTPQEKIDTLKAALIPHLAQKKIAEGGGIVQYSPEVQAEQAQAGLATRPEEVEKKIAGDPVAFLAFGKGLEGISTLFSVAKPVFRAGAKLPGVARAASALAPESVVGGAAELTGAAIRKTAPVVGPLATAGVVAASVKAAPFTLGQMIAGAVLGRAGGLLRVGAARELAKKVVKNISRIGGDIESVGQQIAGKELPKGAVVQGVRDVLQSLPSAAGSVAHGAILDLGLAALTSTTPEDQQGLQLGTIFGAAQGLRKTGAWAVSGQKIAPRPWGAKGAVASSKLFPIFDKMHADAYAAATPGVREHVNAARQFLEGVTGEPADVFLANSEKTRIAEDGREANVDIEKALIDSGFDATTAEEWAKQEGIFTADMPVPGKPGETRRVIILGKSDAAPHEAKHAFQDVLGEQANQVIDKIIKDTYADQWEQLGQEYAEKLIGRKLRPGESWHEHVLDASGDGNVVATRKLEMEQANRFSAETGAAPRPENLPALPELQKGQWRNILKGDEVQAAADRYMAREIAAESFASIFKNLGASLQERSGIIPWLARVVAATTEMLGGDSLAGRETSLGIPLQEPVVQAIKQQARDFVPEVTPKQQSPPSRIPIMPRAPLPSGAPAPITPEDRAAVAEETRMIAQDASDQPVAGGTRSEKELLGEIATAQATGDAVKINYLSAPDEPAAAISSNRTVRRQIIELFRTMPAAARSLWEKNFFPERVRRTQKGKIQVGGWAPEVFASNAHKTAQTLAKLDPALSPYELDPATGSFTEAGWRELYEDTQKFVQNQMAGRTGSGVPLVVPGQLLEAGFFKGPQETGAGNLDQRKADFISAMFGMKLPETPRMREGKFPLNIAGQIVSEATIPGRVEPAVRPRGTYEKAPVEGRDIAEVNPWRAEFERAVNAAGAELPSVIEAFQWLNLENIKEVQHTPEQPQFRGNTLTLQAGFKPKPNNPRAIKSAAVKDENGKVWEERFHGIAQDNAQFIGNAQGPFIDGFTTNSGEFLTRDEAYQRAIELKQVADEDVPGAKRFGLETNQFNRAKQFKPAEKKDIELIGPDGKSYKARFDGYWDLSAMGRGQVPALTALEDLPGSLVKGSSGMGPTLEKAGYKLPTDLPAPESPEAQFSPRKRKQTVKNINEEFERVVSPENAASRFQDEWYKALATDKTLQRIAKEVLPDPNDYNVARRILQGNPEGNFELELSDYAELKYPELVAEAVEANKFFQEMLVDPSLPSISKSKEGFAIGKIVQEGFDAHEAQRFLDDWRDEGYLEIRNTNPALADWIDNEMFNQSGQRNIADNPEVQFKPSKEIQDLAKDYTEREGIPYKPLPEQPKPVNVDLAKRIADFYDSAEHAPTDEQVKASYDALAEETVKQYQAMKDAGYTVEPWTGKGEPYESSAAMLKDVQENKHLWFLPTEGNFSDAGKNLMLRDAGVDGLSINDVFRAVHDFFGHAKQGYQFGPKGELNAWNAHSEMYSDQAQGALAAETLAQNSWVNYGKHLRGEEGNIPAKGETGYKPLVERPFAQQKNIVVPAELIAEAKAQFSPEGQFKPKKKAKDEYKFVPTQHGTASKAWILPSGKIEQLGAQWHHDWLDQNPEVQKKYGLKIPPFEGGDTEGVREQALRKGFARVNLEGNTLVVEAREKDWRHLRPIVEDLIEKNLDDIDKFRVNLLNDKIDRISKSYAKNLFDADTNKEKMGRVIDEFSEVAQSEIGPGAAFQPNKKGYVGQLELDTGDIEARFGDLGKLKHLQLSEKPGETLPWRFIPETGELYWWFGIPDTKYKDMVHSWLEGKGQQVQIDKALGYTEESFKRSHGQFKPRDAAPEQEQLFGGREYVSPASLTREQLKQRYPEAIVPTQVRTKAGELVEPKIASDIVGSPLYKKSENPVQAFADKLVEFANSFKDNPVYQLGLRWYSDFAPMLKKEFGKDAPMMAELLAASSPNEKPDQNFYYAVDALEGFKSGRFDKIIDKFNQGFDMMKSDKWLGWYNKELNAGNIPNPPQNPTPEAFMAHWIFKHKLKPLQSNGKLFGFHGRAILEVMARKWLEQNQGPKVANFVQNLQGTGHEATIDVWADRTMRRVGYQDFKDRWRIMPANGEGVSDADFAFAQKAFRAAADKLGIEADALQGGLWFAEKQLWSDNGWGRLDLGSYVNEMAKLPLIRQAIKQRLSATEKSARVKPAEELQFELAPRPTKQ